MKKYKNKYRITSPRLPKWDYAGAGHYFITLVVQGRHSVFGHIANKKMILNAWGRIAYREWFRSFDIRNELYCREFVLMPNHLHALVTLSEIQSYPREFLDPPIPPQMVDEVDPVDPVGSVDEVDP